VSGFFQSIPKMTDMNPFRSSDVIWMVGAGAKGFWRNAEA
jgi:hypothetical protein